MTMGQIRIDWTKRRAAEQKHLARWVKAWKEAEEVAARLGDAVQYRKAMLVYFHDLPDEDLQRVQKRLRRPELSRPEFLRWCQKERGWERDIMVFLLFNKWLPLRVPHGIGRA